VSARNMAQMAVGDGVPHFVLLSASAAPLGISGGYIESKREAEKYVQSTGLTWTIVRAPALYEPGERRNPIYRLISLFSYIPLLGLLASPHTPIAVDTAARGIASLAMSGDSLVNRMIGPRQLRRVGRQQERQSLLHVDGRLIDEGVAADPLDEPPFGWLPSKFD
jgi:uncharacterized protein YbjT (DUF2867 family)